MRTLLTLAALLCLTADATADTITTTDGKTYTRAADGHYYPSAHVTATGAVVTVPVVVQATPCPPAPRSTCPRTRSRSRTARTGSAR